MQSWIFSIITAAISVTDYVDDYVDLLLKKHYYQCWTWIFAKTMIFKIRFFDE